MTRPLGFANNYALGIRRARAAELGIKTISDLKRHPNLRLGFSNEFLKRADGWPGLRARYGLPQADVRGLDHRLAYEGLRDEWESWSPLVAPGGVMAIHDSRASGKNTADSGSVRYTNDVVVGDPRFEVIDTMDSLTVLRRRT